MGYTDTFGIRYGVKSRLPVLNKITKRFGSNMISSIANKGLTRFMIYKSVFNADFLLNFLGKFVCSYKRRIFIILDNHKVHHCRKVMDWFEKHKDEASKFSLPAYALELNIDKILNRSVRSNIVYVNLFTSQDHMIFTLKFYLFSLQYNSLKVKRFFNFEEVLYKC